jgi:thiol-disulfide isomerase/thioredoxin
MSISPRSRASSRADQQAVGSRSREARTGGGVLPAAARQQGAFMIRRTFILAGLAGLAASVAGAAPFVAYEAASFEQLRRSAPAVVVHVHADWCPTCRAQAPTLTQLSQDPAYAAIRFVRVDFDRDAAFKREHRVAQQSTIIVFRGGQEVDRLLAVTDPAEIRERIRRGVARPS